jgi:hypothetical protein
MSMMPIFSFGISGRGVSNRFSIPGSSFRRGCRLLLYRLPEVKQLPWRASSHSGYSSRPQGAWNITEIFDSEERGRPI